MIKSQKKNPVSRKNMIELCIHCKLCVEELKKIKGVSLEDYQRIQAGLTKKGLQIWCVRHNCNIINVDFGGREPISYSERETIEKGGERK